MNVNQGRKQTVPAVLKNGWASDATRGDDINIRVLLGTLNYRRWFVILPAGLLALIAAVVALQMPDGYTSTTQVMLNAREPKIVDIDSVISTLPGDANLIEGEISVIQSNETLHRVLTKLDLYSDPEFNTSLEEGDAFGLGALIGSVMSLFSRDDPAPPGAAPALTPAQLDTIKNLRRSLEISQVGLSLVISISANSENPDKAARIANGIAQEYIDNQVSVKSEATQNAAAWLRERAEGLRQRLEESELAVESFKTTIITGEGQTTEVTAQQLAEINSQLVLARGARAEAEARLAELNRRVEAGGTAAVELLVPSPSVAKLRGEIEALAASRSDLAGQYGPANPRLQHLDRQIRDLEARLGAEIGRAVDAAAGAAATAAAHEAALAASLGALERQLADQSTGALRLRQLERVAEADRNIYQTFLLRLNELTEQAKIQQADARIISSAVPAELPSRPNRKLIVAAAGLFGVLIGCAIVFVSEALTSSFRTDIELRERLGLRTLARMPRVGGGLSPLQVLDHARRRPLSELGRAARDMIVALIGGGGGKIRTILVTSANSREGRTTLCLLLADFLARIGQRAVVIDCDFRNPALARILAAREGADIVDAIAGGMPAEAVVRRDPASGIEFIPIVDAKGYGPEILYTEAFEGLLATLASRYDFVILDAAPLNVTPDACAMSRYADLVIFAVRWCKTSEQLVESGVKKLFQSGARRIGATLTLIDVRQERLYRKRVHNLDEV